MDLYTATRRQDGRTTNEDAFLVVRGDPAYAALCDGSGTAQGSGKRALDLFRRLFEEAGPGDFARFPTWANWGRLLDSALMGGPQSTFLAVVVAGEQVYGCCMGDSRLFRLGPGDAVQIVTEDAAKMRLGSGSVDPYPIHLQLARGEALLLASDGAWTPLGAQGIRRVWRRSLAGNPSEFPALLLAEAAKHGCGDDMTAIALGPF